MKVLQINPYFNYGSTGKIEKDINDYLNENGAETYIAYVWETGFSKESPTRFFKYSTYIERCICALLTRVTGNRYGYAFFSTFQLKRYIKRINPDIVQIHCINGYDVNIYSLFRFLKKYSYKTVITEHAEFFHTGNCAYAFECDRWIDGCHDCPRLYYAVKSKLYDSTGRNWEKFKKAFNNFSTATIVSVSDWLRNRTVSSKITEKLTVKTILNGINTDCFRKYSDQEISDEIKKYFYKKTVLFITSSFYSEVKGGKYVLQLARELPQYNFIIICSGNVDCCGLENVRHINFIQNQSDLAKFYSLADLTVLTSKKETFSMPVAESLCCGTPVAGFCAGGPESIAIPQYSDFVEYGNVKLLKESIEKQINAETDKDLIASTAKEKYSSNVMAKHYYNLYTELMEND